MENKLGFYLGYGHIAPKTVGGKMFCLLYALVGIPIMIVFTASIGDLMADALRWIYSRVCCRWCRVRRRDNEIIDGIERKKELLIISDEVGKGKFFVVLNTENTYPPLYLTNSNFPPLFVLKSCQICQIQWKICIFCIQY